MQKYVCGVNICILLYSVAYIVAPFIHELNQPLRCEDTATTKTSVVAI